MSATILTGLLAFASLGFIAPPQEQVVEDAIHQLQAEDIQAMTEGLPPDPCLWSDCSTWKKAAKVRIEMVFKPEHWQRAWNVAGCESGWHFHPWIENYEQFRKDTGKQWTPERARYVPAEDRIGHRVYGIFQHKWRYWKERTGKAFPGLTLDPMDGWHNVLMGAWIAYELPGGWNHYECYCHCH